MDVNTVLGYVKSFLDMFGLTPIIVAVAITAAAVTMYRRFFSD